MQEDEQTGDADPIEATERLVETVVEAAEEAAAAITDDGEAKK